ncbi:unnamed protein product [Adineta steineri]|uniref:Transcriptional regulator ATRX-like protein n=1 Tax=Adineta steineri TaxID=433720 RepID=A0A815DKI5_9BILA|nr:unnamed protein product [Adineta steineri]
MTTNGYQIITWLKAFKTIWLPENIPGDVQLRNSVVTKILELEELIFENTEDEEEYHRAKLLNNHSSSDDDNERINFISPPSHEQTLESTLLTPPDNQHQLDNKNDEEQSRKILLEQSDDDEHEETLSDEDDVNVYRPSIRLKRTLQTDTEQHDKTLVDEDVNKYRPSIRLKRISQAEAERFIPSSWKNSNSKISSSDDDSSSSQKNRQEKQSNVSQNNGNIINTSQIVLQSNSKPSSNHDIDEILSDDEKISKLRLRKSTDDDQASISSKKSNNNETSTISSTSDEDFTIKLRERKSSTNKKEKSSSKLRKNRKNSHKKNEIVINYNPSTKSNDGLLNDSSSSAEEIHSIHEDQVEKVVKENKVTTSSSITLNVPQEKPMETNDNHVVENGSNNGNNSSPSSPTAVDITDDKPPVTVLSYGHLLAHSNSSSSSSLDSDNADVNSKLSSDKKKQTNNSKRSVPSSPNSDIAPVKKKSRSVIKQRAYLSLTSSDDDSENKSAKNGSSASQKQSTKRLRIQRSSASSSEESKDSNKNSRQRRRKSTTTNESSKEAKRKTNKKKPSISSTDTSDGNSSDIQPKTKKSKSNKDNNEETTDDEDISPSKGKHGRKNIRKIIDDKELDIQTKDAIEAEQERRQRIADKQKAYNDTLLEQSSFVLNNSNDELNQSQQRLILEKDKITNEPLIEVVPELVVQLKPHQCEGVRFLWNNVFESIEAIQKKKLNGNGCILAHCMGLGKTLQIISFLHTVFNYDKITKVKTCLVLCPINAALNWTNEFEYWLKDIEPPIDHYQLTTIKRNLRVSHLNYWYENGGVAVMGYEMYKRLATGLGIKNKKHKTEVYKCLVDPGPDIVVADEGHILKNAQTALAKCLSKIKTPRRIVLTGTPLQNNLIEYYCMVSFIKPSLLGTQQEYINRFVNPIQNGQHRDSNEDDVRLMKRRACVLHGLLTGFVDRKDYSLLKEYLPPKFEYIINIRLSDLQSQLYETYLKKQVNQEQRSSTLKKDFKSAQLFADYQFLQKIWTHPFLLYPHFIDRWKKRLNEEDDSLIDDNEIEAIFSDVDEENIEGNKKKDLKLKVESSYSGFLIDNINNDVPNMESDKPTTSNSPTTILDSDSVDDMDAIPKEKESDSKSSKSDDDDDVEIIKTYPTRSRTTVSEQKKVSTANIYDTENDQIPAEDLMNTNNLDNIPEESPWLDEMREQFWFPFLDSISEEHRFDLELSGKFLILKFILDKCFEIGDKVLLFSRSLYTLNYIEKFLKHLQIENEKEYQKQCESRRQLRELLSTNETNDNVTNAHIPEPIEWIRDQDYFRMDGQTDVTVRKRYAKSFNNLSNSRARLFLISTLAGGIGINLTGSNRVIVFDASWNPSHDTQAIFRSYRFGQKKPVYIYRFLAHGTMEEKIYQRQVVKQSISQRVIDDHQLDRHFTQNDIKELYNFKPEKLPEPRSASTLLTELETELNYPIPKDHLLFDLLCEHNRWIQSYHSHDSLLENKLDEGLTVEERRKALEEYENLKRLPDPRVIAQQRFQQQQQLNAFIAQQQRLASASAHATNVDQQNFNRLLEGIHQSLQAANGQNLNYNQLLQFVNNGVNGLGTVANGRTNNTTQATNIRPQKSTTGTVPILPRPPAINMRNNDIILVDSDGETDNNNTNTISK